MQPARQFCRQLRSAAHAGSGWPFGPWDNIEEGACPMRLVWQEQGVPWGGAGFDYTLGVTGMHMEMLGAAKYSGGI